MTEKCLQCGSQKIIPDISLCSSTGSTMDLSFDVHPEKFFDRQTQNLDLRTYVCCDCGYIKLAVRDLKALNQAYATLQNNKTLSFQEVADNSSSGLLAKILPWIIIGSILTLGWQILKHLKKTKTEATYLENSTYSLTHKPTGMHKL